LQVSGRQGATAADYLSSTCPSVCRASKMLVWKGETKLPNACWVSLIKLSYSYGVRCIHIPPGRPKTRLGAINFSHYRLI
jgi:hypothetical protein